MDEQVQVKHRSPRIIRALLTATVAVMLQVGVGVAQSSAPLQGVQARPVIDERTYSSVLDIVFPRAEPSSGRTVWAIVLRFRPNSMPESQIVIRKSLNKVQVVEYTPAEGSIYAKLNDALERGVRRDAVELAKSIRVSRREVGVPHVQVKRWYATLFNSVSGTTKTLREALEKADSTGVESFVLHGSVYELWYAQGLKEMSFSLYDVDIADARSGAESKLVQWMDIVRRDVQKLK
jgi:hypothetical protein